MHVSAIYRVALNFHFIYLPWLLGHYANWPAKTRNNWSFYVFRVLDKHRVLAVTYIWHLSPSLKRLKKNSNLIRKYGICIENLKLQIGCCNCLISWGIYKITFVGWIYHWQFKKLNVLQMNTFIMHELYIFHIADFKVTYTEISAPFLCNHTFTYLQNTQMTILVIQWALKCNFIYRCYYYVYPTRKLKFLRFNIIK